MNDARWPQPEIVLSLDAQAIDFFNTVAPRLMDWAMAASTPFMQATGGHGGSEGNLFRPRNG